MTSAPSTARRSTATGPPSSPRPRPRASAYQPVLTKAGYGADHHGDPRGARVLLRRGLSPAVPRQEPLGLLRHRRHGRELPVGPGVGRSQPVSPAAARLGLRGERAPGVDALREDLLDRLRALYPEASRRSHKQWIEGGRVTVNGLVARDGRASVVAGDRVALRAQPSAHQPGRVAFPRPRSG